MSEEKYWKHFCVFLFNILNEFFQVQMLYWSYLRNGWSDWREMKSKYRLDTGSTLWPWPHHDLDLEFFKVKFWNSSISVSVGLNNLKRKRSKSTGYWTLPFDHTHGHCLDIARTKFEKASFREGEGRLTWNEMDVIDQSWSCPLPLSDYNGVVDVPDIDRRNFRRQCAIDTAIPWCVSKVLWVLGFDPIDISHAHMKTLVNVVLVDNVYQT